MRNENLIIGSGGGGGGKGGGGSGGSTYTPTESPDSLHSRQYARVIDLVSEGEIGGLVNGLRSVFINDTPLMNADGTYNFSGVILDGRTGTQNQTPLEGFPNTESETSVGVQVKYGIPVVRSITELNADSAVVTVGIPQLTYQNPSNGDLSGTSVQVQIEVQSNGGGYQPIILGRQRFDIGAGNNLSSGGATDSAQINVAWQGVSSGFESMNYQVQGSLNGGAWQVLSSGTLSGYSGWNMVTYSGGDSYYNEWVFSPATGSASHNVSLTLGNWVFRVVPISGTGSLSMSGSVERGVTADTISGKTTSRYKRSYRVPLPGTGPWDIRVTRLTADSTQANLANQTWWDSFTTVVESKLSYPNSALWGLQIDATYFSSVPTRGYEIYGLKVRVPSNYYPESRTYVGVWDGTFKMAWTNNPAWIFYDLLTAERYGLGEFITDAQVDKWALYEIAQYCDAMVPNGYGGYEPRFTCSLYLQSRDEAIKVVNEIASVFRGMAFWMSDSITAVADMPADPIALFTSANVSNGDFNYAGSSRKARHTVALVTWNDPANSFKQAVEYVEDPDGIARYGVVETEIAAVGCTSKGQAHRVGRWLLYTERMETEVVTFRTGLEASMLYPGAIIQVADNALSGNRMGGRTFGSTASTINLDSSVTIDAGVAYTLLVTLPDGSVEEKAVSTGAGTHTALTVSSAFSQAPQDGAIWILSTANLQPQTFRVMSVIETDGIEYEVTALVHHPEKYDLIEQGITFNPRNTTGSFVPALPTSFKVTEVLYESNGRVLTKLVVGWSFDANSARYKFSYKQGDNNYTTMPDTFTNSTEVLDVVDGSITFRVTGVNALGRAGQTAIYTYNVLGKSANPGPVEGASITVINNAQANIEWKQHADLDVRIGGNIVIRHTPEKVSPHWANSVLVTEKPGIDQIATVALMEGTYLLAARDQTGHYSDDIRAILVDSVPHVANFNFVQTLTEAAPFPGVKDGVFVEGSALKLTGTALIDDMTTPIDEWPMIDYLGGMVQTGYYYFENDLDLGAIYTSRLTAGITLGIIGDVNDIWDNRTDPIDEWPSIDGNTIDATVEVQVRTTTDDPAAPGAVWSDWNKFFVGDYTARGFQFRLALLANGTWQNVEVLGASVTVDMPDRVEAVNNLSIPATGTRVSFANAFRVTPAIGIMIQDMQAGDTYELTNPGPDGFDIVMKNGGSGVIRTIDYFAKGYGMLLP